MLRLAADGAEPRVPLVLIDHAEDGHVEALRTDQPVHVRELRGSIEFEHHHAEPIQAHTHDLGRGLDDDSVRHTFDQHSVARGEYLE
jgi:hypothetical protein